MIWVAKGRKSPDETQTGSWLSSNGKLHNQQISGGFQVMRQGFLHFTNYGWSERNIKQNKEKAKKKKNRDWKVGHSYRSLKPHFSRQNARKSALCGEFVRLGNLRRSVSGYFFLFNIVIPSPSGGKKSVFFPQGEGGLMSFYFF